MDRVLMWDKNIKDRFCGEAAPFVFNAEQHLEDEVGQTLYTFQGFEICRVSFMPQ